MQNRYVGDIGDYVKYGLLRALTKGRRLGVAWYLFPDESNTSDGGHIKYLKNGDCWRNRDPELFDTLKRIVIKENRRSVDAIEKSEILKGAEFSNEVLSAPLCAAQSAKIRSDWRSKWFKRVQSALCDCDVVFIDPDNGLCEDDKFRPGTVKCWKRLPLCEAKMLAQDRTAIIYHHNTRRKGGHREEIRHWKKQLGPDTRGLYWHGAWSNRTFFIVNPAEMNNHLEQFACKWEPNAKLI